MYILGLVLGNLVVVALMVFVILRMVRASAARARHALDAEVIEMESERRWVTAHFRNFRSARLRAGAMVRKTKGSLVITRKSVVVFPDRYGWFPRSLMARVRVRVDGDAVELHTDEPPNATRSVTYRVPVDDPARWVTALVAAGAKAA